MNLKTHLFNSRQIIRHASTIFRKWKWEHYFIRINNLNSEPEHSAINSYEFVVFHFPRQLSHLLSVLTSSTCSPVYILSQWLLQQSIDSVRRELLHHPPAACPLLRFLLTCCPLALYSALALVWVSCPLTPGAATVVVSSVSCISSSSVSSGSFSSIKHTVIFPFSKKIRSQPAAHLIYFFFFLPPLKKMGLLHVWFCLKPPPVLQ